MRLTVGTFVILWGAMLVAQSPPANQQSEGVHPRAQPTEYASQDRKGQAILAASVVPPEQAKQRFAYDISKTYLVVEVACYPGGQGPVTLHNGDFSIRLSAKADSVYPAEAATVAAKVQHRNTPSMSGQSAPVYGEASVGYERGTDPYTGRRVSTVYTGGGVGVGGPPVAPYPPGPSGYPIDQPLLEEQLWHRGLPEGTFTKPVAGYLYFPISLLKKEKGFYLLQVLGQADNSGYAPENWELRVPLAH